MKTRASGGRTSCAECGGEVHKSRNRADVCGEAHSTRQDRDTLNEKQQEGNEEVWGKASLGTAQETSRVCIWYVCVSKLQHWVFESQDELLKNRHSLKTKHTKKPFCHKTTLKKLRKKPLLSIIPSTQ